MSSQAAPQSRDTYIQVRYSPHSAGLASTAESSDPDNRSADQPFDLLLDIAQEVKKEISLSESGFNSCLDHAIRAGGLLIQAKQKIKYGEWTDWVKENCSLSARHARRYMLLASVYGAEGTRVSFPSLRAALEAVLDKELPKCSDGGKSNPSEKKGTQDEPGAGSNPEPDAAIGDADNQSEAQRESTTGQSDGRCERSAGHEAATHQVVHLKFDRADLAIITEVWDVGYRTLSKRLHPDMEEGDKTKQQELNRISKRVRHQLKKVQGGGQKTNQNVSA